MRRKMLYVALAAVAVVAACAGGLAARSSADTSDVTPAWLASQASAEVKAYADTSATTVEPTAHWALTTVAAYRASLPEKQTATVNGDKPLYVVIADGQFTAPTARADSPTASGTQLLLVFDADTQELSVVGVLNTPVNESLLGTTKDLALMQ